MPGLLRGMARVAVASGTATAVSNRVERRQSARWAAQDQASYQEAAPPPTAAPAGGGESRIDKLKALGELKAQGVLNDAEFEAEKARILG
jgi:hypothetical protein